MRARGTTLRDCAGRRVQWSVAHVYGIQFDIEWEDKGENHRRVVKVLEEIRPAEGSLVVLPELFDVGFSLNTEVLCEEVTEGASEAWCSATAKRFGVFLQGASIRMDGSCDRDGDGGAGKATNNAVVFDPAGNLVCRYAKVFPFSGGDEPRKYRGGDSVATFDWRGIRVCPLICYDLRFPELWRLAAIDFGVEMFTCGASWPAVRQAHWSTLLRARAIENQAYVVGINRCGNDINLSYIGGSKIVEPRGEVVDEAGDGFRVVVADIDGEAVQAWRAEFCALRDVRREMLGRVAGNEWLFSARGKRS